jgi:predicted dehydrogenase
MSNLRTSRRAFVGAALSSAVARTAPANDRIAVAMVGVGGRGSYLLDEIEKCTGLNAAVTAVCDVYRPNLERAAQRVKKTWGADPFRTVDFRDVLARRDIDAVVIATPDFGHSRILQEAVHAGKDAYCEKPMGVDFAEAKAAYLAVKKSDRVVQIGTQRRSEGPYRAAAKLVHSGVLGQITRVDMSVNFQQPRWRRDHSHVTEKDVAWKEYLFNRPFRPFDARQLREWQLFRDYTNGISGLWMCHYIDQVHWFLQDPYPAGAVANGGVFLWRDGRQTSDVFHALLDYPKGFLVSFAMSLTNESGNRNLWCGTRGTLDMENFVLSGAGSQASDRIEKEVKLADEPTTSHMRNFLECVRSRQTPRADIQAGFSHAVACCMAAQALESGRRIKFDRVSLALV